MQIEGTKKAFFAMLAERGVYKKLGVTTSTISGWKHGYSKISIDKMEELLELYGAKVVQEKVWEIGKKSP